MKIISTNYFFKTVSLLALCGILYSFVFLYFHNPKIIFNHTSYNNQSSSNTENQRELGLSNIEIADTPESRLKGLMFRKELCDNCGMLFVFEKSDYVSFWMKDTLIPLDIIFIKESGTIANIAANTKTEQTSEIYTSSKPVKYVLEVNANWSQKNNFKIGDTVKVEY